MKLTGSLMTRRPLLFSLILCSVLLGIAAWLICVSINIADDFRVYVGGIGKGGAQVRVRRNVIVGVVLVATDVCISILYVLGFSYWGMGLMRREMFLNSALIKQKEATEEAEKKSMSKSFAVANASHEVRTALAGIIGLIQMCRAEVSPRSSLDQHLKHMESCTNDLHSLLNSILDASKIEAGKVQLEEEEFDLQELLEDVVDLYYPVGINKGVDVILDPCDESVENFRRVKGDRGKLKQVLSNLLYNSIKFTDEGYVCLRVWARKPTDDHNAEMHPPQHAPPSSSDSILKRLASIILFPNRKATIAEPVVKFDSDSSQKNDDKMEFVFDVVDTGKGIPKEKHKSVFENYVQVKDSGGNKGPLGHGLGLAIVRSLVRLMGGEIGIIDKEFGEKGTCFRFNAFMESTGGGNNSTQDIEFHRESNYCDSSSKVEQRSSHVILFLQSEERTKVAKTFLESRGVKVSVVDKGYQQLRRILKKMKRKLFNDGATTSPSSSSSSSMPKEATMPLRNSSMGSWNMNYMVLLIIDTSVEQFAEVSRTIVEFYKDLKAGCARVLWIDRLGTLSEYKREKLHLPSTDVVVSKSLQGSRLHFVLGLLPEFASSNQLDSQDSGEIQVVIDKKDGPSTSTGSSLAAAAQNKAPLAGKKILVVEDNLPLREICSVVVTKLGAIIHKCCNGEEALQVVSKALQNEHQFPYHYILMDCEMPIMDGFEATRRIKKEWEKMGIKIPIIALTAHTGKEEINKITEAGMDYYLPKPLNAADLLTAIQYLDK